MTGKPNETETRADALKRILKEEVDQSGCGHVSACALLAADIHCQSYHHVYYFLFGTLYCGIETPQGLIKQKAYYDPKRDAWFKIKCNTRYAT
jgi:ADP-ribose pyrophosphatase YjhB (NUDIX family)